MKEPINKRKVEKTELLDNENLKEAKRYFNQIKKINKKLNNIDYYLSDSYSTICLFKGNETEPIDSL